MGDRREEDHHTHKPPREAGRNPARWMGAVSVVSPRTVLGRVGVVARWRGEEEVEEGEGEAELGVVTWAHGWDGDGTVIVRGAKGSDPSSSPGTGLGTG